MKMSITFDTDDEAGPVHDMVDRVFGGGEVAVASDKKETAAEKKKRLVAEKKAAEAEAEDEGSGVTRDDVRAKLKEYAALEGKDAAIGILKDNGAASIGELDEASFDAVIAACE